MSRTTSGRGPSSTAGRKGGSGGAKPPSTRSGTERRAGGSRSGRGSPGGGRHVGGASANRLRRTAGSGGASHAADAVRGSPKSSGSKPFAGQHLERVGLTDRASWRDWLEEHHLRDTGVWLVSFKKTTGKPRVEYDDAVEEALCFGWIDSVVHTLDAERAMQLFTPRRARSPWSQSNKLRVERLLAAGLMRAGGLAKIEEAKRDGSWDVYAAAESLELPADLRAAFDAGPPGARSRFDAFSPSSRRAILWWVHSAKRPATRARRIAEVVDEAAHGRRANFPEDRRR